MKDKPRMKGSLQVRTCQGSWSIHDHQTEQRNRTAKQEQGRNIQTDHTQRWEWETLVAELRKDMVALEVMLCDDGNVMVDNGNKVEKKSTENRKVRYQISYW